MYGDLRKMLCEEREREKLTRRGRRRPTLKSIAMGDHDAAEPPRGEEEEAAFLFREDGCVVLRSIIPSSELDGLGAKAVAAFDDLLKGRAMALGQKGGYREIVHRHRGRYEMRRTEDLRGAIEIIKRSHAMTVAKKILGPDAKLLSTSVVIAEPNCRAQAWHCDGPHLSLQYAPCHCLNIFVPLIPVNDNGTQLRPGTHFLTTSNFPKKFLAARARKTLRPPITPHLCLGDCLLFDYRILHRGGHNPGPFSRPILVLTVAKPWFNDILNFPSRSIFDDDDDDTVVSNCDDGLPGTNNNNHRQLII